MSYEVIAVDAYAQNAARSMSTSGGGMCARVLASSDVPNRLHRANHRIFHRRRVRWRDASSTGGPVGSRCEASPSRSPDLIAAGMYRALRHMWQRWCAGLPPESFSSESNMIL